MGPKKEDQKAKASGGGSNKKGKGDHEQQQNNEKDQKLQAILLADSFTKTFRPVTWETPKVLLPLVNVPMLEYTIEFLAQNGVEELFVFCVWHADMLQAYLNSSKWPSTIIVRCITSAACLSAGDALRELDSMGVIRSDPFILISGDVISNMDLKKAIAFHKEKRKEDHNCIMTVTMKQVQRVAGAKPLLDDLVVGMDRITSQVILFENNHKKDGVNVPLEIMADHPGCTFMSNLMDCHVDVCSPELMLQFSDNFDYQNIRRDFIRNEVVNWELGMHIYGYLIQNEYAARVHDLRTYHAICRDIVNRWVYPLVPDAQMLPDASYVHTKRYVYKESAGTGHGQHDTSGCKVARSAYIGEGVVLGRGCRIEDNAKLERVVVGRGCVVGERAVVVESHLWAGAVVEEDAVVESAVICDKAVVKKGARVGRGCVVSYGAVVGAGVVLPDYTRVSCLRRCLEDDEEEDGSFRARSTLEDDTKYDLSVVGVDGVGFVWTNEDDPGDYDDEEDEEDDDDDEKAVAVDSLRASSMGCTAGVSWRRSLWQVVPPPVVDEDSDDDDDMEGFAGDDFDCDFDDGADGGVVGNSNNSSSSSSKTPRPSVKEAGSTVFVEVVADMVSTGHAEGHPPDNLLMEIKGYKFAQNSSFADCIRGCVPSILAVAVASATSSVAGKGAGAVQVAVVTFLKTFLTAKQGWGYQLLRALVQDTKDEFALVEAVESHVLLEANAQSLYPVFRLILQLLYDEELVSEEALVQWIEERNAEGAEPTSARGKLFKHPQVQTFVAWIQEDEDDDDEDDEDDED